jgi:hypothetical protein
MRKLIRANGVTIDLPERLSMLAIRELIGARVCDSVCLRHLGEPLHVMILDDEGWETMAVERTDGSLELVPLFARRPVNDQATELYHANCWPGTKIPILGDVVIVPDSDFTGEGDSQ